MPVPVERSFTDGLHIPMDAIGAKTCAEVVGTNLDYGVTWLHSYVTPDKTKTNCVRTPTVVSTTMLAVACEAGTPRRYASRMLATSPPMLATGNNELMDSRIQRIQIAVTASRRLADGISSRHDRALKVNGTRWNSVIGISHQPTVSIA